MTQEEKARAYDEALEKARQLCAYPTTKPFISDLQDIFPELKESEDEKIRKEIINYFEHHPNIIVKRERKSDWIAWLEKQGEHKPIQEFEPTPIFRIGDILKKKGKEYTFRVDRIQGGYYHCDRNHGAFFPIEEQDNWELVEQKPAFEMKTPEESLGIDSDTYSKIVDECVYGEQKAAWSEEDNKMSRFIGNAITTNGASIYLKSKGIQVIDAHVWLDELKDRVQPKQEWSEDDERKLGESISLIRSNNTGTFYYEKNELISFLKSLRPQSQWKPSDEQMDALRYVTNFDYGGHKATLVSLYEQLKKLK